MENYDGLLYAPSDVALELAKRLKAIRKRKKITQHQLASRSNVSYASLCIHVIDCRATAVIEGRYKLW